MKKTKTVLVTGVFDLLHQEHAKFLVKARALGDRLVIGIESDKRVKELKGEGRPINNQLKRRRQLERLKIADKVLILPEKFSKPQQHLAFLKQVKPDILAVSSHTAHQKEKASLMQQVGGKLVVVHKHNPEISTSKIIENLK
jgi:D-beta-D-heptose 7-phosphate kinase/D-beta-D-heptose 1-phosphate adenosyltransferase